MQPEPSDTNTRNSDADSSIFLDDDSPIFGVAQASEVVGSPSSKKSLWEKAKESLGEVSTQASKVAKLGTAGAAKSAAIGKQTLAVTGDVTRGAIEASKLAYSAS